MTSRTAVLLSAVVLAAAGRWLPHLDNFAPMTAMAVFAAARLSDRRLALGAPLIALGVSDLGLEVLHRLDPDRWPNCWSTLSQYVGVRGVYLSILGVYLGMAAAGLLGLLARRRSLAVAVGTLLGGSVAFFLVSNFACWVASYPPTLAGLMTCYEMALPFYRNSLLGDCIYGLILFGGLALAEARFPALRQAEPRPA
jgi:hypothetical protein